MSRLKNKFLSVVLSAAMVVGMLSPMGVQARAISSGDEYLTTAAGQKAKVTVQYGGTSETIGVLEGDMATVVDGDYATGVNFRGNASGFADDGIRVGDYIQVEYEEAFTLENAVFAFKSGSTDIFQESTFSYSLDGVEWVDAATIGSSSTMIFEADEPIEGVKAIKLTNNVEVRKWLNLNEIEVNVELPYVWNTKTSPSGYEKVYGTATAPSAATEADEGAGKGIVGAAVDNSLDTFWHSAYDNSEFDLRTGGGTTSSQYSYIEVALSETADLAGAFYVPRQLTSYDYSNGAFKTFKISVKTADSEWVAAEIATINGKDAAASESYEGFVTVDYEQKRPNEELEILFAEVQENVVAIRFDVKESYSTGGGQENYFLNAADIAALKAEEEVVVVDKTVLNEAIAAAEALTAEDYTAESWAAVEAALTAAKELAEDATQEAVDAAAAALNAAVAALEKAPVVVPVDKTALNEAIAAAEALTAEDYTAESWAAVEAALTAAKELEEDAAQEAVDAAAAALNAAVAALVEAPVVEEPVAAKIENVTVTASSVDTTEPAHNKAPENVLDGNNTTFWASVPDGNIADEWFQVAFDQTYMVSQVDYVGRWDSGAKWGCTGNILAYVIEVSMDGAEWTQVAEGTVTDGNAVAAFDAVEANYVRVRATKTHHWQDGTNGQPDNRNTVMTIGELAVYGYVAPVVETADKTALGAKLEEAKALDMTGADPLAVVALINAMNDAEAVFKKDDATQAEVDAALAALEAAMEAFGAEPPVEVPADKTALQAAVEAANLLNPADYVDFVPVMEALDKAWKVIDDADATQEEVDAALAALNAAVEALEEVPVVVPVDKTALNEAIAAAEALAAEDYTAESWAAVEAALTAAKELAEDATQEEVDAAAAALNAAVAALVDAPVVEPEVTDPADASLDVPVEMYKPTAGSTQPGNSASAATDGYDGSFWEVVWDIGANEPSALWYQVELADEVEIQAVRYLPRWGSGQGDQNGFIEAYKIMVSLDGETWTDVAEGTWPMTEGWKIAEFDAVTAKYVRLLATGTYADVDGNFGNENEVNSNMSIAEFRVKATGEVINRGELKAAIAKAEALAAEDYKNFDTITAPLAAAKEALTAETQEAVDAAAAALEEAIAALVKVVKKDALIAAIADAKEVDQELYTSATAKALANAIAAGEDLVADETATQEVVDAATAGIAKAKAALVAKATADEKAALQEAVDAAEAMDTTEYTEESVAALEEAIAEAKAVLENEDATSKDVEDAAKELQAAVDALEIPVMEDVVRVAGATRYETGYKVADALKEELGVEKFDAVIVATGKNFADALAGSYLAVQKNAPIILTNGKDDNIAQLHAYIAENVVAGGKVYILGGEGAVPAAVAAIEGYDVVRLAGKSRYETNLAILAEAGVAGDSIIVATGKTFADSLSASAAKLPILLVKPEAALTEEAKAVLGGMKNIYIIGGEGAVSADIAAELAAFGEVTRVSGATRYETSVAVAKTFFGTVDSAVVASGKNFPDGLCGGPLAAAMNAPLILTADAKTDAAAGYMAENAIAAGYVLGGTGALADESVVDVFALESADEIVLK